MSETPTPAETLVRLVGVYDADGTVLGEVSYWLGVRLGRRHCSLCDITHSAVRAKAEWNRCAEGLPVPFETYHRNDQPPAVRLAADGRTPVVVAETDRRLVVLLGDEQLRACAGSVDALRAAVDVALTRAGLTWTSGWA